jgi:hypothetical protein
LLISLRLPFAGTFLPASNMTQFTALTELDITLTHLSSFEPGLFGQSASLQSLGIT